LEYRKYHDAKFSDAVLVVTPYYNRPPQSGMLQHYLRVAKSALLPVILYNVPSRTGVDLLPETVAELARTDNIVAIKEASPQPGRIAELIRGAGDRITILVAMTLVVCGRSSRVRVALSQWRQILPRLRWPNCATWPVPVKQKQLHRLIHDCNLFMKRLQCKQIQYR